MVQARTTTATPTAEPRNPSGDDRGGRCHGRAERIHGEAVAGSTDRHRPCSGIVGQRGYGGRHVARRVGAANVTRAMRDAYQHRGGLPRGCVDRPSHQWVTGPGGVANDISIRSHAQLFEPIPGIHRRKSVRLWAPTSLPRPGSRRGRSLPL